MTDPRKLKLLATAHCKEYACEARFYIQEEHPSGQRHLVVQYGEGYSGRDDIRKKDGTLEFAAAIPQDMSEQEIVDGWLLPPMNPGAPYPKWEVPARRYGSSTLFRWWAGEKPE